jgi:hypothetical protein
MLGRDLPTTGYFTHLFDPFLGSLLVFQDFARPRWVGPGKKNVFLIFADTFKIIHGEHVNCPISSFYQRLILREMKKPGTTACPGRWAMETNKIVCGEEKIFCSILTKAYKAGQNLSYRHDKPNEPTNEGLLLYALHESPFTSAVSKGHPSLVSLVTPRRASMSPGCVSIAPRLNSTAPV